MVGQVLCCIWSSKPELTWISLGLTRLEYRGYDSAGLAVDGDKKNEIYAFKEVGKVAKLRELIAESEVDMDKIFDSHVGIAHTRWATHGQPSRLNCHPHRSVHAGHSLLIGPG
jgi:glutamine---fructose-6-phosphate transaminase (isomerizing)